LRSPASFVISSLQGNFAIVVALRFLHPQKVERLGSLGYMLLRGETTQAPVRATMLVGLCPPGGEVLKIFEAV
jgi:hypothetical protein